MKFEGLLLCINDILLFRMKIIIYFQKKVYMFLYHLHGRYLTCFGSITSWFVCDFVVPFGSVICPLRWCVSLKNCISYIQPTFQTT